MAKGRDRHQARQNELNLLGKPLAKRAKSRCELCSASGTLHIYEVPPVHDPDVERCILICETCSEQIDNHKKIDLHHWLCLHESMWSEVDAVKVVAWRMLSHLRSHTHWAQDLLDQMYLDEETQKWAEST